MNSRRTRLPWSERVTELPCPSTRMLGGHRRTAKPGHPAFEVTRLKYLLAVRNDLGYSPCHLAWGLNGNPENPMLLALCCAKFCGSGMSTSHTHFIRQIPTPAGPITPGSKSRFMKMACIVVLLCAATAITSSAQSFQTLHGFSNRGAMAASPGQDWCRVTTASANEWDPRSRPSLFTD